MSSAIDRNSLKVRGCGFFVLAIHYLTSLFTPLDFLTFLQESGGVKNGKNIT